MKSSRLVLTIIFIFGLYLIVSFGRDLWVLYQKTGEIAKSELKRENLRKENEILQKQFEYVKSSGFVEKEAREKLGLAREGETVIILPENLKEKIELLAPQEKEKSLSNWEKWWRLFF